MKWLFLLLLASCATTRTISERSHPPEWPDTARTIASIRCALEGSYEWEEVDQVMNVEIVAVDDYAVAEHIPEPIRVPMRIYVNANARTALSSALRHAIFLHALPHALDATHDANRLHASTYWAQKADELEVAASRCRLDFGPN